MILASSVTSLVFIMYIIHLIIFEEKVEVQDQYPLNLNPDQKAYDPIQDRYRSIGPFSMDLNIHYSIL